MENNMEKLNCTKCMNKHKCKCNECLHFYMGGYVRNDEPVDFKSGSKPCYIDIQRVKDIDNCLKHTGYIDGCFRKIDWVYTLKYNKIIKDIKKRL